MPRACCYVAVFLPAFALACLSVHAHLFWYAWSAVAEAVRGGGLSGVDVDHTRFAWYSRVGRALSTSCHAGGLLRAASATLGTGVCKPGLLPPSAWERSSSSSAQLRPLGSANATLLVADPPIWIVDGLFDAAEAAQMVAIGAKPGRMQAAPVGAVDRIDIKLRNNKKLYLNEAGGSDGDGGGITAHEVQQGVPLARRIAALAQVPLDNLEYLQIQRTLPGEYYNIHHDFNTLELFMPSGPRLWTVLMYCSTVSEGDGGETSFPMLGVKVRPVLGRALFWPNVFPHTLLRDVRTMHASLLLRRGAKHAVNLNVHAGRWAPPTSAWGAAHTRLIEWVLRVTHPVAGSARHEDDDEGSRREEDDDEGSSRDSRDDDDDDEKEL
jgi:hypothetical protein